MLKIVYTTEGITVTRLTASLEKVVAHRAVLAVRLGHALRIEKGTATLLFPRQLEAVAPLAQVLELSHVDSDYLEGSFSGVWISQDNEEEGVFLVQLPAKVESRIAALWQATRLLTSVPL